MVKKILLTFFFLLFIFCVFQLFSHNYERTKGEKYYSNVKEQKVNLESESQETQVDISSLMDLAKDIPDFRGYIQVSDTNISYPLVQSDDNDFYLNHLPNQQENSMGSIFIDYRNNPFQDFHTVIYGHNISQGGMFKDLEKFKQQTFFESQPTMSIETKEGIYYYELYAVYLADATKEEIPVSFHDSFSRKEYIDSVSSRALYKTDVSVTENDYFVSLCTCTYDFTEARIVVVYVLKS